MADLLPSSRDTSAADEPNPRVVGLDSDEADDLLAALSSDTARTILATLHEEPDTPASISDRVDTSLQNVQYHLGKMREAGLVEVIDTVYSEKGREMDLYAPADRPLVVFAGKESESLGLKTALTSLLGGVAVLGVLAALIQWFYGDGFPFFARAGDAGADGASQGGGDVGVMTAESASAAAETGSQIAPGLVFFLGGAVVLLAVVAVWYWRR
jgi:DNA-binding transcriptional ArsR family regulator